MPDKEKVIKVMEKLREYADSEVHPILSPDNWGVYSELRDLIDEAEEDTLALLKAQEPRLVTEADFENADEAGYIPAWYEEKDTGEVYCECISIGALEDAKFGHVRWWTFRPTEEQREKVKWK